MLNTTKGYDMKIFSKMAIIVLLASSLYSDSYYEYNMFDAFNVVSPKNIKQIKPWLYLSKDKIRNIGFIFKALPSGLKYNFETYDKTIKKIFDDQISTGIKVSGMKITSFYSKINKDKYILYIYFTQNKNGEKTYFFTKQIAYKKMMYYWTVMALDKNIGKTIFNEYKDYIKIAK